MGSGQYDITIETIMSSIHAEARRIREIAAQAQDISADGTVQEFKCKAMSTNVSMMRSCIAAAEYCSNAGTEVPPMDQFRGITRKLALLAGRMIVFLSSFITERQRSFNSECISSLKLIVDDIEKTSYDVLELKRAMDEMRQQHKKELDELMVKISNLESNASHNTVE